MSRSEDRLALAAKWPILLGVLVIGALVTVLGVIDQHRAATQLRELERGLCQVPPEELPLAAIDKLASEESPSTAEANALVQGLSGITDKAATATVFYEANGTVWWASGWGGSMPAGPARLPKEAGLWSVLRASESCRAYRSGDELAVVRSLHSPSGTPVVMIFTRLRGRD